MSPMDQIVTVCLAGCLLSLLGLVIAAFADWPTAPRHLADGDDASPRLLRHHGPVTPATWTQAPPLGRYIAATRPLDHPDDADGVPPLIVNSPPGALGVLPAQGLPIHRPRWACGLCHDGTEVIGESCIWCGCKGVMQP